MSELLQSNTENLRNLGELFRKRRRELRYSQQDLANLSGLTTNTISAIEKGHNTSLDNFYTLCKCLRIQPREMMAEDIEYGSPYPLPPSSKKRLDVAIQLEQLIYHSDFFERPRRISEVLETLQLDRSISNRFSVYLSGYCQEGVLEYTRQGKVKHYKKKS